MTVQSLNTILKGLDIPVAYRIFKTPQNPPYIIFYEDSSDNEFADNSVYKRFSYWTVLLYCDMKNPPLERKIEGVLPPWNKIETYIDDERLLEVSYSFKAVDMESDDE